MMALFRENAKTLTHCLENYIMHNAVIYIVKTPSFVFSYAVFCIMKGALLDCG